MINCPRKNSQASGPMTNQAGCKHIYCPASDFFKNYLALYIDVNVNNMIFVGTYCLFVTLVVSFHARAQMTLRGPQINNMPSKNHVIVLFKF
jgi:hypothetical protein